jgi:hypothetical protein
MPFTACLIKRLSITSPIFKSFVVEFINFKAGYRDLTLENIKSIRVFSLCRSDAVRIVLFVMLSGLTGATPTLGGGLTLPVSKPATGFTGFAQPASTMPALGGTLGGFGTMPAATAAPTLGGFGVPATAAAPATLGGFGAPAAAAAPTLGMFGAPPPTTAASGFTLGGGLGNFGGTKTSKYRA